VASVLTSQLLPLDWLLVVPPMTIDAMTAKTPTPARIWLSLLKRLMVSASRDVPVPVPRWVQAETGLTDSSTIGA
jgi:hypothetical protein